MKTSGDRKKSLEKASRRRSAEAHGGATLVTADLAAAGPGLNETAKRASFEWPPALLEKVIDLFLVDAPLQIVELQAALQSRDNTILRAVSHKIRGSSDVLGTISISALAKAVEEAARRGDFKRAAGLAPKLVEELQQLLTELTCVDAQDTP